MLAKPNTHVWVVAYINTEFLHMVHDQLSKSPEYAEVEAYIPTIKVLKKQFKGKEQFEEVPLLFNYGFFKIPRKFAVHRNYLDNMQKNISCIFAWVRDGAKAINTNVRKTYTDRDISIGTCSSEEIAELIKATINIGAHGADEINLLKPGDYITLRGYPWEGSEAIFREVLPEKQKVKVQIILFNQLKEVEVSYDNVFFTIYKNYDENKPLGESLDEMKENRTLDKFTKNLKA